MPLASRGRGLPRGAGDGRVTRSSLLARDTLDPEDPRAGDLPLSYAFFVCEEHDALAGNATFRDDLLNILLC